MLANPGIDDLTEFGILGAKGDSEAAAGPQRDVLVHGDVGKYLLPELRQKVVDDGYRHEAGIHHLEDVIVFEDSGSVHDDDGRLAALLELSVQTREALVVNAPLADEHFLAGEVVHRIDLAERPAL